MTGGLIAAVLSYFAGAWLVGFIALPALGVRGAFMLLVLVNLLLGGTLLALASRFDVPFLWTLPAAALVAALLGSALGAVVFRVKAVRGELFALVTLAFTFVVGTMGREAIEQIVIPVEGIGMWGTMYGFLAIDSDTTTAISTPSFTPAPSRAPDQRANASAS